MTIQEAIKDGAAIVGTLGTLATVVAHLPFIPARWAEALARFASYTSSQFDVTRKSPPADGQEIPVHITIPPDARTPEPPSAALRSLLLACLLLSCSPSSNKEARQALGCIESTPVRECLAQFKCDGPEKPCSAAHVAYSVACLDLCEVKDASAE